MGQLLGANKPEETLLSMKVTYLLTGVFKLSFIINKIKKIEK
jgi:hypothetical protein